MHSSLRSLLSIFPILLGTTAVLFSTEASQEVKTTTPFQSGTGFQITVPADWTKVTDQKQVQKRLLWCVVNYNNSVWGDEPLVHAWDGPGSQSFLTTMTLRRDPTYGLKVWHDELFFFLKQNGAIIPGHFS